MSFRKLVLTGLVVAAVGVAGCGSDDSSSGPSEADSAEAQNVSSVAKQSIEAIDSRDAKSICALITPTEIKAQFKSKKRCVKSFGKLLKQGQAMPAKREITDVTIDGDRATVKIVDAEGNGQGEAMFVNVDGKWYLTLSGEPQAQGTTEAQGTTD